MVIQHTYVGWSPPSYTLVLVSSTWVIHYSLVTRSPSIYNTPGLLALPSFKTLITILELLEQTTLLPRRSLLFSSFGLLYVCPQSLPEATTAS